MIKTLFVVSTFFLFFGAEQAVSEPCLKGPDGKIQVCHTNEANKIAESLKSISKASFAALENCVVTISIHKSENNQIKTHLVCNTPGGLAGNGFTAQFFVSNDSGTGVAIALSAVLAFLDPSGNASKLRRDQPCLQIGPATDLKLLCTFSRP